MARRVVYLDIPAFPATVEQIREPAYRGRPLVVASGGGPRAIILSASHQARIEGVGKGMPVREALKRVPDLTVLDPDFALYRRAMRAVLERLQVYSPLVEPERYGHVALDMTGSHWLFRRIKDVAYRIYQELRRDLRLPSSLGIAENKLVSGVAARYVQEYAELFDVLPGCERSFLEPLEVNVLPAVGYSDLRELLAELNIRTVGLLAAVPLPQLMRVVGPRALRLHQQALGIDPSPVRPPERASQIKVSYTFSEDTNDVEILMGTLFYLVEQGCQTLRRRQQQAGRLRLFCRYADQQVMGRTLRVNPPSALESVFYAGLQQLEDRLWQRRVRIRYLSLTWEKLVPADNQLTLFGLPENSQPAGRLAAALDHIRTRYGYEAISFGRTWTALPPRLSPGADRGFINRRGSKAAQSFAGKVYRV